MLILDMLVLDPYLYHLTIDVLSPDMLLLDICSCYVITYQLPLLWHDLSPVTCLITCPYHVKT